METENKFRENIMKHPLRGLARMAFQPGYLAEVASYIPEESRSKKEVIIASALGEIVKTGFYCYLTYLVSK